MRNHKGNTPKFVFVKIISFLAFHFQNLVTRDSSPSKIRERVLVVTGEVFAPVKVVLSQARGISTTAARSSFDVPGPPSDKFSFITQNP